jgi:hypothetical protein
LFKTLEGRDLYKTLTDKFGHFSRNPYHTPRDSRREKYLEDIIK